MGSNSGSAGISSTGKIVSFFAPESQKVETKPKKPTVEGRTDGLGQTVLPEMANRNPSVSLENAGLPDGDGAPRLTIVDSKVLENSSSKSASTTKKTDEVGTEVVEMSKQESSAKAEKANKAHEISTFLHAKVIQSKT